MQTKLKYLAAALAVPLITGALSAFLTHRDMASLDITKPLFYPPDYVFPIVWTILYLLMGIASYRIMRAHQTKGIAVYRVRIAIAYYVLGLAMNFIWPFIFFSWQAYTVAFAALCALVLIALRTYHAFTAIDKSAGFLLLPYIVWLLFAGYLNLAISLMN